MTARLPPGWELVRHDRQGYEESLTEQRERVERRLAGLGGEVLILTEHPPVCTVTRNTPAADLPSAPPGAPPLPVVPTDRGGRATVHAPGQLVAYVIRDLRPRLGVREHVWRLEETVIRTLAGLGVAGVREAAAPGVWVDPPGAGDGPRAKIAALGVRVRRGIAHHGLALNRDPDLGWFGRIVPCGLAGRGVTSLAALGVGVGREELEERFVAAFGELFGG